MLRLSQTDKGLFREQLVSSWTYIHMMVMNIDGDEATCTSHAAEMTLQILRYTGICLALGNMQHCGRLRVTCHLFMNVHITLLCARA